MLCNLLVLLGAVLCLIVPSSTYEAAPGAPDRFIIESPMITNFGVWGKWEYCPEGTFATAAKLKVESSRGPRDDTALNAIRLSCGNHQDPGTPTISSSQGGWGDWLYTSMTCPNYLVGFELKSVLYQGAEDDTGATNIRFQCLESFKSSPRGWCIETREQTGLDWIWGHWTDLRTCGLEHAICGIQTQVEANQGFQGDDTTLNNVRFACCKVK